MNHTLIKVSRIQKEFEDKDNKKHFKVHINIKVLHIYVVKDTKHQNKLLLYYTTKHIMIIIS